METQRNNSKSLIGHIVNTGQTPKHAGSIKPSDLCSSVNSKYSQMYGVLITVNLLIL